jgi:FkbM family methyltransferase
MFQSLLRDAAVKLFGLASALGLQRFGPFNRLFLAAYGFYKSHVEAGPIDRLQEFVPPGSLVIDVGANVGFFALRFAQWVGAQGRVIAIEPEEQNCANLKRALERAQFAGRVDVRKAVAAATPGAMLLEINPLHPADHKLSRDGTGVAVEAITLDGLVGEHSGSAPSLIKIDVQGAEMLVLEGAAAILETSRPALFVELHEEGLNRFGTSVATILAHLCGHGYQPYWLMRRGPHTSASAEAIHAAVARVGYVDILFLKSA